jgi:peptidoglycan hydrolase-like protein with peptidoglycan-binding domain
MRADGPIDQLRDTTLYQQASTDDQLRMATVVGKLANQTGDRHWQRTINKVNSGEVQSLEDLKNEVPTNLRGDRDNALRGAELAISLRNATPENPLHGAWNDVIADPLVNPSHLDQDPAHADLKAEYSTIKSLFTTPAQGQLLVQALDDGRDLAKDVKFRGAVMDETAGLYASGHDFVHWNRDGQGYGHVEGKWQEIDRNQIIKSPQSDGTVELATERDGSPTSLLRVTPMHVSSHTERPDGQAHALHQNDRGAGVGKLQQDLAALGFTAYDGSTVVPDSHFGARTKEAVESFQRAHGLSADGVAGTATLSAVAEARAQAQPPTPTMLDPSHPAHGMFTQAYSCVARLDEERGAVPGLHTQAFAGSLTSAALAAGFNRIDHVVLSDDACRGYAVQGALNSPFKQYTDVNVMTAIQTPLAQSSQEATVHLQAAEQRTVQGISQQQTQDQASQGQATHAQAMTR